MKSKVFLKTSIGWTLVLMMTLVQTNLHLHLHWCGDVSTTLQKRWSLDETSLEPNGCCASDNGQAADCCHHKVISAKSPLDQSIPLPIQWDVWAGVFFAKDYIFDIVFKPNFEVSTPLCPAPVYVHGPPVYLQHHQLIFYA